MEVDNNFLIPSYLPCSDYDFALENVFIRIVLFPKLYMLQILVHCMKYKSLRL